MAASQASLKVDKMSGNDDLSRFPHKYLSYLLPALFKVTSARNCRGMRRTETEKIVRYEVEMALAVSADGFSWSQALKAKLEREGKDNSAVLVDVIHELLTRPIVSKTLTPESEDSDLELEEEEVNHFMGTLRSALPGGAEMGMGELVSEVESYIACLQMQVALLKSLLDAQLGDTYLT